MPLSLHRIADLTTQEKAALRALTDAVYPAETIANWPGRSIEWASADWCVVWWNGEGQALSYAGLILRNGKVNDDAAKIGGIGGVKTHPNARRQGLASQAIEKAIEFFAEQDADFALLVCEPGLVPIYERIGWKSCAEPLYVTQHGKRCRFTFNLPMVHSVRCDGPTSGAIDLLGPPW